VGVEAKGVEAGMAEHAGDGDQVGAAAHAVRADYLHHSRRHDPGRFSILCVAVLPRAVKSSMAQFCQSGSVRP
jgi:hypothetical protein